MALNERLTPAKVMCKTCGSTHSHKASASTSSAKVGGRKPVVKTSAKLSEIWNKKLTTLNKDPQKYSIRSIFKLDDVIQHPQFGVGFVSGIAGNDKIEVTFQNEIKTLVHKK